MKKSIITILVLNIFGLSIFYMLNSRKEGSAPVTNNFSDPAQLAKQRRPSAINKKLINQAVSKVKNTRPKRKILGVKNPDLIDLKNFNYVNNANGKWEAHLSQNLMNILQAKKDIKLKLKHQQSAVLIKSNKARYVEQVLVEVKDPTSNLVSTFNAMVDSETGHILRTWGRPRFENKKFFQQFKMMSY